MSIKAPKTPELTPIAQDPSPASVEELKQEQLAKIRADALDRQKTRLRGADWFTVRTANVGPANPTGAS